MINGKYYTHKKNENDEVIPALIHNFTGDFQFLTSLEKGIVKYLFLNTCEDQPQNQNFLDILQVDLLSQGSEVLEHLSKLGWVNLEVCKHGIFRLDLTVIAKQWISLRICKIINQKMYIQLNREILDRNILIRTINSILKFKQFSEFDLTLDLNLEKESYPYMAHREIIVALEYLGIIREVYYFDGEKLELDFPMYELEKNIFYDCIFYNDMKFVKIPGYTDVEKIIADLQKTKK